MKNDLKDELTRSVNFSLGIVILSESLIYMFTREFLRFNLLQLDIFIVAVSGVVSVWAGNSKNCRTIRNLNFLLGLFYSLFRIIFILLYHGRFDSLIMSGFYDISPINIMAHVVLGFIFLILAFVKGFASI